MPTIKQIAANRLNALRSSGPRSVAGKAVSSMNALGSGIDAKSNLIRGEDSAALETLTREYRERFLPATPEERLLVDILIHDEWLLRRFRRIDAEILECEMQDAWTPKNDCAAGQAFTRGQTAFSRLQRRIDSPERSYHRSLESLGFLRQNPDPPPPPADDQILEDPADWPHPPSPPDPDPIAPSTPAPPPDVTPMPSVSQPQIGVVPQLPPPPPESTPAPAHLTHPL